MNYESAVLKCTRWATASGWEYQDAGEYEAALEAFQKALTARERYPEMPALIRHAKEAMAEALRALGRDEEAAALISQLRAAL